MEPAVISLDGLARGDSDRQEFSEASIPVPIIHKDFNLSLRTLTASRERGEALDTTQVRTAGRLVAERLELLLFEGGVVYGGNTIHGYTTHPDRNTSGYSGTDWSDPTTTGAEMLTDIGVAKTALQADRYYGPYWIYTGADADSNLDADFKAETSMTIRERLLAVESIERITIVDQLADNTVLFVQPTSDVVELLDGEALQTVQWDLYGGMAVAFKAFTIQIPLIKSDSTGRSGILHMS